MKRLIFVLTVFIVACGQVKKSELDSAMYYLEKSIYYHDPLGKWPNAAMKLTFDELDETRGDLIREVTIINETQEFVFYSRDSLKEIQYRVQGDSCDVLFNKTRDYTADQSEQYHLNCQRANLLKNYYTYLYGLPMKLKDPGTIVHDEIIEENFNGQSCYSLRVTYEKHVGSDTWYFYLDKETYALKGYRFHHDVEKFDGEFIVLDGEVEFNEMKIPRTRSWYYNGSAAFLGTDMLSAIEPL